MKLRTAIIVIALMLALLPAVAMAQALTCTQTPTGGGGFRLDCKPATPPTRTPTRTPSATAVPPTATATPVPATATTTATPMPPTATPVPPTPPMPVTGARVNVPLTQALPGDPALNWNNYSLAWLGQVADSTYTDVRLLGAADGLRVRLQLFDSQPTADDAVTLAIGDWSRTVRYGDTGTAVRGSDADGYRGWTATLTVPWADLGGRPTEGGVLPARFTRSGYAWQGDLHWGLPDYAGRNVPGATVVEVPLAADTMVGGGTDCGAPDFPLYFPTWGSRNWGASPYLLAQNQGDVADWPCYAKILLRWRIDGLPADAQVISATLVMRHFGDPGYGEGSAADGTGDTVFQMFEISPNWEELRVGWDSMPVALENVSRALVKPVPDWCVTPTLRFCNPPVEEFFDVTELTRRALRDPQRTSADAAIYTAAGQYHSGKHLWSTESDYAPQVRIAYVRNAVTPAPTPVATPVPPPTLSPTPTRSVPPTNTPTVPPPATATVQPGATPSATRQPSPTPTATPRPGMGKTIRIAPGDAYPWQQLLPGDTLILRDGTYPPMRPNVRNGEPGKPITIKAENDGKAIIDGKGQAAIQLGDTWPALGPDAAWWVLEGLVARNGGESTIAIRGHDIVMRRISAYDADPDGNSAIIWPYYSKNILIEDCIAAGTGRKTITIFSSEDVTIRRCYSDWARWDGLTFCGVPWPGGNGIHIYNGHRIRVENSISVGPVPDRSIAITNQSDTATITGVEVLGSIAVGAGRTADGQPYPYPFPGPGICGNDAVYEFYPGENAGFVVYGQGPIVAPVFRDILATNNANEGFGIIRPYGTGGQDVILDHATLYGNGMNLRPDGELTVTNSKIEGTSYQGEGARLTNRYVDGVLIDVPLWPWPMEARAQAELGVSITEWAKQYVGR